eukprot:CAMPEP_0185849500 /NCGR_PEP_ID=MMETSP1354-20130828/3984_1 /TAXON_ID=708628 /ORGANISM="Erythrolobus madagascarensis, Strain CCMP3276" /LENGTH=266 /DNA_ID=CAMNT_0028550039 /DNA_START=76 /DNA_END=876 /DNA_ORIENTATION=-
MDLAQVLRLENIFGFEVNPVETEGDLIHDVLRAAGMIETLSQELATGIAVMCLFIAMAMIGTVTVLSVLEASKEEGTSATEIFETALAETFDIECGLPSGVELEAGLEERTPSSKQLFSTLSENTSMKTLKHFFEIVSDSGSVVDSRDEEIMDLESGRMEEDDWSWCSESMSRAESFTTASDNEDDFEDEEDTADGSESMVAFAAREVVKKMVIPTSPMLENAADDPELGMPTAIRLSSPISRCSGSLRRLRRFDAPRTLDAIDSV